MATFKIAVPFLYASKRIDAYLAGALAGRFSRQEIKKALEKKEILLNDRPARPRDPVREGDRISGQIESAKNEALVAENIPFVILFEDENLLVVDKPAGMVVHPGAGVRKGTLVHALLGRGGSLSDVGGISRPGIVHRLDRDTSGILLVAKNNVAHKALQWQFASRSLSKTYTALVQGRVPFEEGHIDAPIGRDPKMRQKMAVVLRPGAGREAQTRYRVLRRFKHATLLEVKLITGRTHQIRVHLAHLGHPVVGDKLYGKSKAEQPRLALHASKIEFAHPKTGKLIKLESSIPDAMKGMIEEAEST